jgi:5-methyltetrahydrofolate--homocysteine methyltransferase
VVSYDATPEEMAELARDLRTLGIAIVGGCCGTSPAHLAAMSLA